MLFLGNLRFALRILRRSPSFAASAIVVMALGIGASTAVFSVVKGVLLTPLPYREPDRVVLFAQTCPAMHIKRRSTARSSARCASATIGASPAQLVGQLGVEGMVLGLVGAAGGLLIATWCVDGLLLLAPSTLPRREVIGVDLAAALFAVTAALLCAIAASLVPAWQAVGSARTNAVAALKQDPGSAWPAMCRPRGRAGQPCRKSG